MAETILGIALLSSIAVLLFISATGFTSQRYMVDFLPLLVLVAVVKISLLVERCKGLGRAAVMTTLGMLVLFSLVSNLALGITGPYDELLANQPRRYVRIAQWFSPAKSFRPMLDPPVDVVLNIEFATKEEGFKEPLLLLGGQAFRYLLSAEHRNGGIILLSHSNDTTVADKSAALGSKPKIIQITHNPASQMLTVAADGTRVIAQKLEHLVTAPAQLAIGENKYAGFTPERFTGRISVLKASLGQ
ncbi:MAG: hypothetical protein WKF37_00965 [Bryobacteraceae bacterium]